jgi:hypothetical protein
MCLPASPLPLGQRGDAAAERERPRADRGGDRDDDQRRRGGGPHALAEDVDEHRQGEDRSTAADGADDQADGEAERDRD